MGLKLRLDDSDNMANNRGTSRRAMGRRVAVRAEQRLGPVDQRGRVGERALEQVVGHQRVSRFDVDRVDRRAVEHGCAVDDVDRVFGEHDGHERGDHDGQRVRVYDDRVWRQGCAGDRQRYLGWWLGDCGVGVCHCDGRCGGQDVGGWLGGWSGGPRGCGCVVRVQRGWLVL